MGLTNFIKGSQDTWVLRYRDQTCSRPPCQGAEALQGIPQIVMSAGIHRYVFTLVFALAIYSLTGNRNHHGNHCALSDLCNLRHHLADHESAFGYGVCLHLTIFDLPLDGSHGHCTSHNPHAQRRSSML
jgi:hypothetical protein